MTSSWVSHTLEDTGLEIYSNKIVAKNRVKTFIGHHWSHFTAHHWSHFTTYPLDIQLTPVIVALILNKIKY